MELKRKLKKALSSIEDAKSSLNRVKRVDEARSKAVSAIRDLDDAESHIKKVMRELD